MKKKIAYRTTMPFDGGLSPVTDKTRAVPMFGDTPLIQDILKGDVSKIVDVRSRGEWAEGKDKDTSKSYKEQGDEFMLSKQLKEKHLQRIRNGGQPTEEFWIAAAPDGKELVFPSYDVAVRELRRLGLPQSILSRKFAQAIEDTDVIAIALKSCVMVKSSSKNGASEIGAGFCLGGGIFVTCAHVVSRYDKFSMPINDLHSTRSITVGKEGKSHPAQVVHIDYHKDLAILKSEMDAGELKLGDSSELKQGDRVFAIGSPRGYENNVSDGIISGLNRSVFWYDGAPTYIFTDAHVLPGNSGGPLLKYDGGEIVGMVSMIVGGDKGLYGLNVALPSSYIEEALMKAGIRKGK